MNQPPYQDNNGNWWDWDGSGWVQRSPGAIDQPIKTVPMGPITPGGPGPTEPRVPSLDARHGGGSDPNAPPPAGGGNGGGPSGDFVPPPERFSLNDWRTGMPTFTPDRFSEPDPQTAMQDPSYQFEASEGARQLQQAAAAKGTLNGGGTLKDILAWGQNYATSRIADVRNRAIADYQLNYQAARDAYQGKFSGWQTVGQMGQRQNEEDFLHAYTPWNDTWNRRVTVATT